MSLRFKGADLRPVLTEAIANQCRIVLVKDQGRVLPSPSVGSVARMDASNCSPTPSAATRTPTRSMTGGTSPAASWVATILRSISTRRTACSRASCTRRTISCCPPPPRTCRLGRGASRLKRQPPRSPRSPRTGAFFVRTAAIAAHARSSPAAKARPRAQRRHATGDDRMNTSSTSPRLHLLPVSLRGQRLRAGTPSPSGPGCGSSPWPSRWSTAT